MPSTYKASNDNYTISFPLGRLWLEIQLDRMPNKTLLNQIIFAPTRNIHTYSVLSHTTFEESIITASTIPLTIPAVLM